MTATVTRTRRLLASTAIVALVGVPVAAANADQPGSDDSVLICHATSADDNPYVSETPAKDGDVSGHADHTGPVWNATLKEAHVWWGDIIPPFDYVADGVPGHFDGLNWDVDGQAWWNRGCAPEPTGGGGGTTGGTTGDTTGGTTGDTTGGTTGDTTGGTTGDGGGGTTGASTGGLGGGEVTHPITGGGGGATLPFTGSSTWLLLMAGISLVLSGTTTTLLPAAARRR